MGGVDDSAIYTARARVLADLEARGLGSPASVTLLEEACSERRWWLSQWPPGQDFVAGLVAQDVQDGLADQFGRGVREGLWPVCTHCADGPVHALHIEPDLGGPDPTWVCEETGTPVAPLGGLGAH
ncbi:hypothetical protein [Pimelobacter sp. 30-1]|uniref:hypothetical protein n=1 Tax=Pimelobacter sp. 30-1 TaxID=2004991 RepID=UPI001C05192F|nr:hypothetical protein [Pimelobacter sp. 30-1]MBU2694627.1 hypothetical protein [Pimelobacter sp. 30-1]